MCLLAPRELMMVNLYILINTSRLFHSPKTTISEIFAVMRQWVPQVQQNIEMLVKEVRKVCNCTYMQFFS